jgi:hypothetical protein
VTKHTLSGRGGVSDVRIVCLGETMLMFAMDRACGRRETAVGQGPGCSAVATIWNVGPYSAKTDPVANTAGGMNEALCYNNGCL